MFYHTNTLFQFSLMLNKLNESWILLGKIIRVSNYVKNLYSFLFYKACLELLKYLRENGNKLYTVKKAKFSKARFLATFFFHFKKAILVMYL